MTAPLPPVPTSEAADAGSADSELPLDSPLQGPRPEGEVGVRQGTLPDRAADRGLARPGTTLADSGSGRVARDRAPGPVSILLRKRRSGIAGATQAQATGVGSPCRISVGHSGQCIAHICRWRCGSHTPQLLDQLQKLGLCHQDHGRTLGGILCPRYEIVQRHHAPKAVGDVTRQSKVPGAWQDTTGHRCC